MIPMANTATTPSRPPLSKASQCGLRQVKRLNNDGSGQNGKNQVNNPFPNVPQWYFLPGKNATRLRPLMAEEVLLLSIRCPMSCSSQQRLHPIFVIHIRSVMEVMQTPAVYRNRSADLPFNAKEYRVS